MSPGAVYCFFGINHGTWWIVHAFKGMVCWKLFYIAFTHYYIIICFCLATRNRFSKCPRPNRLTYIAAEPSRFFGERHCCSLFAKLFFRLPAGGSRSASYLGTGSMMKRPCYVLLNALIAIPASWWLQKKLHVLFLFSPKKWWGMNVMLSQPWLLSQIIARRLCLRNFDHQLLQ